MQLSLAALSALIAAAAAVKVEIQVQRPGSDYHQKFIETDGGDDLFLEYTGGGPTLHEFTPDFENGDLSYNGKHVAVDPNQKTLYLADQSSGKFSEKDGYLAYNGDTGFSAVLSPVQHQQVANIVAGSSANATAPIGLVLRRVDNGTSSTSPVHSNPTGPVTTTVHHNSTASATSTVVKTITSCGDQGCHVLTQTSPVGGHATSAGHASGAQTVVKTITSCGDQGCHVLTKTGSASGHASSAASHASAASSHASAASGHASGTGAQQVSASHSSGVAQVNGAAKVGGAAAAVFGAIAAALL